MEDTDELPAGLEVLDVVEAEAEGILPCELALEDIRRVVEGERVN